MSIEDPVYLQRVRWRCRRGLLELDIVLGRFIDQHYPSLNEAQRLAFDELLDLPDTEFWDLITGNKEPIHPQQRAVLECLQEV
ncbi:succinate dehydrogenase assembly factor 2 [Ferrigenium sp. UT5]|uniref:FAD assembly factor SdhE n=1 Tax=Ferrigenium sp. UT5 TaxID=3242105 RepID=UPI00354C4101